MSKPDNAKPGCFSGFLHILLCDGNGNSPRLHLSDHITESYEAEIVQPNKNAMANATTTPGVIARLMGLDSQPNTNLVSKGTTPDSVPRSRSVNFVDYMLKFDISKANHRQVKTSASFREVPQLFQQQNHDLVVHFWDSGSKDHEVGSNLRKQEIGLGEPRLRNKKVSKKKEIEREKVTVNKEKNQGKIKKISKLKNEPRMAPAKNSSKVRSHKDAKVLASVSACSKNCSYRKSGSGLNSSSTLKNKQKKVSSEPKQTKNIGKQQSAKKIDAEYSSENLSPVSVLDINDYTYLYGPDFLDYTSPLMSKSKWESSEIPFLSDGVGDTARKNKGYSYPDINGEQQYLSELELKLRTLTENDMRESDFTKKRMCEIESFEEVCLVCEHKIFDLLLHEVVDELVELSC